MWQAPFKEDRQLIQDACPVLNRHRPFLRDVLQGQIEQFVRRFFTGEGGSVFDDLAQRHIGVEGELEKNVTALKKPS